MKVALLSFALLFTGLAAYAQPCSYTINAAASHGDNVAANTQRRSLKTILR